MRDKPKTPPGWSRLKPGTQEKRGDRFWNWSYHKWTPCGGDFPLEKVGEPVDDAPFVIRKRKIKR